MCWARACATIAIGIIIINPRTSGLNVIFFNVSCGPPGGSTRVLSEDSFRELPWKSLRVLVDNDLFRSRAWFCILVWARIWCHFIWRSADWKVFEHVARTCALIFNDQEMLEACPFSQEMTDAEMLKLFARLFDWNHQLMWGFDATPSKLITLSWHGKVNAGKFHDLFFARTNNWLN